MFKTPFFLLAASIAALGGVACSSDHGDGGDDAGIIVPDSARMPDAVVYDAGPPTGNIGGACAADTDCTGSANMCITDPNLFPGGYCTTACDPTMPTMGCPSGSTCQDFGGAGQQFCVLDCDSTMTSVRQCHGRAGYGCSQGIMFGGGCYGGCFDATDCGAGLMCDQMGGQLGSGACYTPGATIGVPCTQDTQCPSGAQCQPEDGGGWPGGACIAGGCNVMTNTGCDGDAQCIQLQPAFGPPTGFCIDGCTNNADCRVGYACTPSAVNPDRHYCAPQCTTSAQCATPGHVCNVGLGTCDVPFTGALGSTCMRFDPTTCAGGTCLSERSSGFPNAYCSYAGCSATEACPSSGVCLQRPGNTGICLRGCIVDGDCTAGYACRPVDPADSTSARACVPACTAATGCTRMGNVCNAGTGLCGPAFMTTNEGMACTSDTTCPGGRCLSEVGFGFPGGECVYPGCGLVSGMGATCPATTACVDDHVGDPALGICAPSCTVGGTTCRAGYACVALTTGGTDGTCNPACTSASCGAGRTCNAASGLCR